MDEMDARQVAMMVDKMVGELAEMSVELVHWTVEN